ncbi:MAG TPA: hypothetical protein VIM11_00575 [Tepidisphaeraceae bacterium]
MPTDIAARIQSLVDQRQAHAEALAQIEETLAQIGGLLGSSNGIGAARQSKPRSTSGHRGRGSYKVTAEDLVLAFVKQQKNPTSREINQHWKAAGRPWTADVTIGKLTKSKRLKRVPLKGQRGSRYSVA